MTRNEQILSEVQKRFSNDKTHIISKVNAFIDGAKWADEHPKPGTVNKQEFIDKAREILKNTIVDDVFANRGSVIKYMSVNEFVEYFCKAMEE